MRDDPAFIHELNFVLVKDGKIIGQNMFMHATIKADDGRDVPILTMGPISIAPGYLNGITGVYTPPQGYFVDDADADAFDKQFPPKEKQKLPGQLFG